MDAVQAAVTRILEQTRSEELICLVGPTASGKTEVALELAARTDGEIVSIDSVQVYRGFNIGSGKPSAAEQAHARHHLVDWVTPDVHVDAAMFVAGADAAIADIRGRGKMPILCGGTFLWTKALLQGLAEAPQGDKEIRARHDEMARIHGRESLHVQLQAVDPISAARLHPNDFVRVSRALEVFEVSGKTLSALHAEHAFAHVRHRYRLFAREHTKERLLERIEARIHHWLASGWIEETEALRAQGFEQARAMSSVGYREILSFLKGELPREELASKISQSTKIYARRQRTWLNHEPVNWLP